MPRFFIDADILTAGVLTGADAAHIVRSLRMKQGDALLLCDGAGEEYRCVITAAAPDAVHFAVREQVHSAAEPSLRVTLYQGFPKADKFETIVQKAVELGVHRIVPVFTSRCVARPDEKSQMKKGERFQKIAREAAGQAGRGRIPGVAPFLTLAQALEEAQSLDACLFCYEAGGSPLREAISPGIQSVGVLIGPEGGFAPEEAQQAKEAGFIVISLGPRILRTETAPVAVLAALQYATGNLE